MYYSYIYNKNNIACLIIAFSSLSVYLHPVVINIFDMTSWSCVASLMRKLKRGCCPGLIYKMRIYYVDKWGLRNSLPPRWEELSTPTHNALETQRWPILSVPVFGMLNIHIYSKKHMKLSVTSNRASNDMLFFLTAKLQSVLHIHCNKVVIQLRFTQLLCLPLHGGWAL